METGRNRHRERMEGGREDHTFPITNNQPHTRTYLGIWLKIERYDIASCFPPPFVVLFAVVIFIFYFCRIEGSK